MAVILESGHTNVGLRAGEFIIKNREMALRQALASQEAQRDMARLQLQREQMAQAQRAAADEAMRSDAARAAEMNYKYAALRQSGEQSALERQSRGEESAASRAHAEALAKGGREHAETLATMQDKSAKERIELQSQKEMERLERNLKEAKESRDQARIDKAQDELDSRRFSIALAGGDVGEVKDKEGALRAATATAKALKDEAIEAEERKEGMADKRDLRGYKAGFLSRGYPVANATTFEEVDRIVEKSRPGVRKEPLTYEDATKQASSEYSSGLIDRKEFPIRVKELMGEDTSDSPRGVDMLDLRSEAQNDEILAEKYASLLKEREEAGTPWIEKALQFGFTHTGLGGALTDVYVPGQPIRRGIQEKYGPAVEQDMLNQGVNPEQLARALSSWRTIYTPDEKYPSR